MIHPSESTGVGLRRQRRLPFAAALPSSTELAGSVQSGTTWPQHSGTGIAGDGNVSAFAGARLAPPGAAGAARSRVIAPLAWVVRAGGSWRGLVQWRGVAAVDERRSHGEVDAEHGQQVADGVDSRGATDQSGCSRGGVRRRNGPRSGAPDRVHKPRRRRSSRVQVLWTEILSGECPRPPLMWRMWFSVSLPLVICHIRPVLCHFFILNVNAT